MDGTSEGYWRGREIVWLWYLKMCGPGTEMKQELRWLSDRSNAPRPMVDAQGYDVRKMEKLMAFLNRTALRGTELREAMDRMEATGKADDDRTPAALVETVIALLVAESLPLVYPADSDRFPYGMSKRQQAKVRAEILRARKLKARSLRELAFHVTGQRVDPHGLPPSVRWRFVWKELDGQPAVWLDRLYQGVEARAVKADAENVARLDARDGVSGS